MAKKKDGSWMFCIDFRLINQYMKVDQFPIPRSIELIEQTRGSKYFISLDCTKGFWQIPLHVAHRERIAFITPNGLFEFTVLPFGLANAPAVFQSTMELVLHGILGRGVILYIDDILIFASTVEDCLRKLEQVLIRLTEHGIVLNLQKCEFLKQEIHYLGYAISGISLPQRISAIQELEKPTDKSGVKRILGLFG